MSTLDQLRTELDRYEAAHGTERRHPDGRLESQQMIALIGRAMLDLAAQITSPQVVLYRDKRGLDWRRGEVPGTAMCCGLLFSMNDVNDARFRAFQEACTALWPDYEQPRL